jgi:LacI family transcriptional regulator
VLFPDLDAGGDAEAESPLYVDQVIRGAERAATAAGDAVLIAATRGTSGRDLAMSVAGKVDGLVIVARALPDDDVATLGRRLPVVVLSDRSGRRTNVDSVSVDNRGGMRALTEHLVHEHGVRSIAFVGGPRVSPDSQERFTGYREALRAAHLPVPRTPDVIGDFTEAGGARATQKLLDLDEAPDAIVCGNDEMALGALHVLNRAKVRVPSEVAVTGFDNLAVADHLRPPLTTVGQPMRDLGSAAVHAVLARLVSEDATRQSVVLPTRLVVRRSCGCRASSINGRKTA